MLYAICEKPSCKREHRNMLARGKPSRSKAARASIRAQIPNERKCAKCGRRFAPHRRDQKNCSTLCGGSADIGLKEAIAWYKKYGYCITSSPDYREGTATNEALIHDEWRMTLKHLLTRLESYYKGELNLSDADAKTLQQDVAFLSNGEVVLRPKHRTEAEYQSRTKAKTQHMPTVLDKFISWKRKNACL